MKCGKKVILYDFNAINCYEKVENRIKDGQEKLRTYNLSNSEIFIDFGFIIY